jgi:hypothetical protein
MNSVLLTPNTWYKLKSNNKSFKVVNWEVSKGVLGYNITHEVEYLGGGIESFYNLTKKDINWLNQ